MRESFRGWVAAGPIGETSLKDVELEDVVVFCGDDEETVFLCCWRLREGKLLEALLSDFEMRGCDGGWAGTEFHDCDGGLEFREGGAFGVEYPGAGGGEDEGVDPAA